MFETDSKELLLTIQHYFEGIFYGDLQKLEQAFHPQCLLFGDINGQPYFKTLPLYLEGVKNRKSPHQLGEIFQMKVLSMEILGSNAVARLHVPMLGYNYYDLLSFSKVNGNWVIVNKLFTHVQEKG